MSILDWLRNLNDKVQNFGVNNDPRIARGVLDQVDSFRDSFKSNQQKRDMLSDVQEMDRDFMTGPDGQQYGPPSPVIQQPVKKTGNPLVDIILPITRTYNIPDAVAAGMYAAEGRDTSMGAKRNNYFNMGAVDSNPQNAFDYATPEEGVRAYAEMLMKKPTWGNGRVNEVPQYISNPLVGLKQIEEQGYAGDKNTYKQRANNGFDRYWKFVTSTPEWRQYNGG